MAFGAFRGYILAGLGGLGVLAAGILLIQNVPNRTTADFYLWSDADFNTGLLMFLSAAGGVVVLWAGLALTRGLRLVWRARREGNALQASQPPQASSGQADAPRE